jgi:hypothetical protein
MRSNSDLCSTLPKKNLLFFFGFEEKMKTKSQNGAGFYNMTAGDESPNF